MSERGFWYRLDHQRRRTEIRLFPVVFVRRSFPDVAGLKSVDDVPARRLVSLAEVRMQTLTLLSCNISVGCLELPAMRSCTELCQNHNNETVLTNLGVFDITLTRWTHDIQFVYDQLYDIVSSFSSFRESSLVKFVRRIIDTRQQQHVIVARLPGRFIFGLETHNGAIVTATCGYLPFLPATSV
ncbi:hypothetical protein BaRGS_00013181 [Batillaria attramentaria]|uniref:Uncharacterized protein n=1 Tax=Batillaria attramentaria TaxID=370345 RepID=A0ABD0L886_9CAEN